MSLHSQLCLSAAILADPGCKNPRGRLRTIAELLDRGHIDKLRLATVLLDDLEREVMSDAQRPAWRKQTRRLAREMRRRGKP